MATVKKTSNQNVSDVINSMTGVGDTLKKTWKKNKDLKTIQTAISAYSVAIGAAKGQLVYKKLTGNPESIEFFNGNE